MYYTRVSIALRPLDGTKLEVTVGAAVGDIVSRPSPCAKECRLHLLVGGGGGTCHAVPLPYSPGSRERVASRLPSGSSARTNASYYSKNGSV